MNPPGPPPGPPPSMMLRGPPGPPPGAPPGFPGHSFPPGFPGHAPPPPPVAFQPPLPTGWSEHLAPDGVTPYYFNSSNKQSTYVRPVPQFRAPGMAAPVPAKKKEKPKEKIMIPGTGWQKITTSEGNIFYFEKATKRSEWSVPPEIRTIVEEFERTEKIRKAAEAAEAAAKEKAAREHAALEKLKRQERARLEVEEERAKRRQGLSGKESKRKDREGSEDEPASKVPKTELQEGDIVEQAGPETLDGEEAWRKAIAAEFADEDQAVKDAKKKAKEDKKKAEKDALEAVFASHGKVEVTVDEQKALFKGLLYEKEISAFMPWESSLPLFINDPRYILLTNMDHRREVFEEYCRDVARARRQGKVVPEQAKKVDPEKEYRALMREEVTSTRTRWEDFKKKFKKDRRFWSWGRDDREREKAFKTHLRELGERKRADAKRAEQDFIELLQETDDITPESQWADVKKTIVSDSRYEPVGSSTLREELFKSFIGKIASGSAPVEDSAAKRAREKKEREEASLRDRQAKVRDEQFKVTMDVNKSRAGAGKEEAERLFGSLLVDVVRDEMPYEAVVGVLEADPRFSHPSLTHNDKMRLFELHISRIGDKRLTALNQLFAANTPKLETTYEEVYPKIVDDFAVKRLSLEGDALEERFKQWKRGQESQARADFDAMLGESAFVDFWGRMRKSKLDEGALALAEDEREEGEGAGEGGAASLVDMAKNIDLKEIHSVLRRDARYRVFDHQPELRERWLKEYMANLESSNMTVHNPGPAAQ